MMLTEVQMKFILYKVLSSGAMLVFRRISCSQHAYLARFAISRRWKTQLIFNYYFTIHWNMVLPKPNYINVLPPLSLPFVYSEPTKHISLSVVVIWGKDRRLIPACGCSLDTDCIFLRISYQLTIGLIRLPCCSIYLPRLSSFYYILFSIEKEVLLYCFPLDCHET